MVKKRSRRIKLSNRAKKRIKYYLVLIGLTGVLFLVSTYSWFITLTNLSIEKFQVKVRSEKGLTISFDGEHFEKELTLSREEMETYYLGNTNKWPYTGLLPMSSAGKIKEDTSRLELYYKHSLQSAGGGYRLTTLLANEKQEEPGYLVFDLFFKNDSGGTKYNPDASANGDSIVSKKDSYVRIETDEEARDRTEKGQPVPEGGDGIENAIRVGFFQIGKVNKSASVNAITGIKCNAGTIEGNNITGLCNGSREDTWNIWEPNDLKHIYKAKTIFDFMCRKRTGLDTYSGNCDTWEPNEYVNTYAINGVITGREYVNIHDGLNGYNDLSPKIKKMDYYTDSVGKAGSEGLFTLGMNSITKVRIYVYLEGQDVDTLDYEKLEKRIKINMVLSKGDIFSEDEE